jgi:outer membrane protein, adhesin transport system
MIFGRSPFVALTVLCTLWQAGIASAQTLDEVRQTVQVALQANAKLLNHPAVVGSQKSAGSTRQTPSAGAVRDALWAGPLVRDARPETAAAQSTTWFDLVQASEQVMLGATRALYELQDEQRHLVLVQGHVARLRALTSQLERAQSEGKASAVEWKHARGRLESAERAVARAQSAVADATARYERSIGSKPKGTFGSFEPLRQGLPTSVDLMTSAAWAHHPSIPAAALMAPAKETSRSTHHALLESSLGVGGPAQPRDMVCQTVQREAVEAFEQIAKLDDKIRRISQAKASVPLNSAGSTGPTETRIIDQVEAQVSAHAVRVALSRTLYDRAIAHMRGWAAVGQLGVQLGVVQANTLRGLKELSADTRSIRCGPGRAELNAAGSAARGEPVGLASLPPVRSAPVPMARPAEVPSHAAAVGVQPAMAPIETRGWTTEAPRVPVVDHSTNAANRTAFDPRALDQWVQAIRKRNANDVAAMYVPGFAGTERSHKFWLARLRGELSGTMPLKFEVDDVQVEPQTSGAVRVKMRQIFRRGNHMELADRTLVFEPIRGQWLISRDELKL